MAYYYVSKNHHEISPLKVFVNGLVPYGNIFHSHCIAAECKNNPPCRVTLFSGVVPANGETDISVTFMPTQFNTCYAKLQITLSQFHVAPLVCTITGSSVPGLEKYVLLVFATNSVMT